MKRPEGFCKGKYSYTSGEAARQAVAALALRRKYRETGTTLTQYECPACRKWHVGHRGQRYYGEKVEKTY